MGDWFRNEFARAGYPHTWRTGSQWFYRQHPQLPRLRTLDDFRHHAGEVEAGSILSGLASMLRECDLVFLNGENFIRPGSHKGRMLLFIAYLAKAVFNKPCVLANHSLDLDDADLASGHFFAATGGTPTVALSANTHKMHSLMRQLRMDAPVFDALQL